MRDFEWGRIYPDFSASTLQAKIDITTAFCSEDISMSSGPKTSYNGKNWCGTVNNLQADAWLQAGPEAWLRHVWELKICTYLVGQLEEAPSTGHQHIQCFLQLKNPQRMSWLGNHLGKEIHWEPMKGSSEEASEYCKKEETRVLGP